MLPDLESNNLPARMATTWVGGAMNFLAWA
jgi:hypothetical protein